MSMRPDDYEELPLDGRSVKDLRVIDISMFLTGLVSSLFYDAFQ
jgi:hypothetical protein